MHYEVASWRGVAVIAAEVDRYMVSPVSGIHFGVPIGAPLTLLAGLGIVALLWPPLRPGGSWLSGMLVWLLVTIASLLVNPLPWQRYYLPLIPVATALVGVGMASLARVARQRAL